MLVLVDLDGTLSNPALRLHYVEKAPKDWKSFHAEILNDEPTPLAHLLNRVVWHDDDKVIICSGRPITYFNDSRAWLELHCPNLLKKVCEINMRAAGDYRLDSIVKEEMLKKIMEKHGWPDFVLDDRPQVVAVWRKYGIPVAQMLLNHVK